MRAATSFLSWLCILKPEACFIIMIEYNVGFLSELLLQTLGSG
jgi:hypothetical protein